MIFILSHWSLLERPDAFTIPDLVEERGIYIEHTWLSLLRTSSSKPPPTTWSSCVENMSMISTLIDESEYFAASAVEPGRFLIRSQVFQLRNDL